MEDKFKEVCEDKRLNQMYMIDVEKATLEAFEKVGYSPSNTIKQAIDKAWVNSNREDKLCDFVYKVWRSDS